MHRGASLGSKLAYQYSVYHGLGGGLGRRVGLGAGVIEAVCARPSLHGSQPRP